MKYLIYLGCDRARELKTSTDNTQDEQKSFGNLAT